MSYNTHGPQHQRFTPFWRKIRDCVAGQEAVHKSGETYLPRLDQQTNDQYKSYVNRALFLNAVGKTVDSLVGLVFRKPPTIELPPAVADWEKDISGSGTSIDGACRLSLSELLTTGLIGWLVDFPSDTTEGQTVAQVKAAGYRPYAKFYPAESIINHKTAVVNGEDKLTLLVLFEKVLDGTDEFDTNTTVDQYRIFDLNDGTCRYRLYNNGELIEDDYIKVNGSTIDYIPFIMVNNDGEKNEMVIPPLNDLANINLSHYTAYADYRHGLHYTALPTPVIIGAGKDFTEFSIGPQSALVLQNENASASYLEFTGQGLQGLETAINSLRDNLATFGARLLREAMRGVEAAETAQINRSSETSNIASMAGVVSAAITEVVNLMLVWANISGEAVINLNKDYTPVVMDAQTLTALVNAYQNGTITLEQLFLNLQRGEIINEGETFDDYQRELATAVPAGLMMSPEED